MGTNALWLAVSALEHKFFFWELISMLIKTILGVGAKITSTNTVAQVALSLVVLSFAFMLQVV